MLRPFQGEAGSRCELHWWDADHGADRQDGRMAVANQEHLPALPDEDAGKLAGREQHHPAAVLPASACRAVRGTVDAAGFVLGWAVAQCKPDEVQSAV